MTRSYETTQQSKFYLTLLYTARTSIYFKGVVRKGARPSNRNVVFKLKFSSDMTKMNYFKKFSLVTGRFVIGPGCVFSG